MLFLVTTFMTFLTRWNLIGAYDVDVSCDTRIEIQMFKKHTDVEFYHVLVVYVCTAAFTY